ncbi:PA0069 family radical SAM protein [Marivibrio halodurans]|uniref:PA0069 family radical SAM protein n=1 Tax=Marivibrio halodurans TaxID=2039722 RepID=A0A8J7SBL1_9PROT|nr:PA0069 family radical SAM protein [Marivibrio halodurans]MBP5859012.1 PA0069 family radical SAM protein [Marivibrio halodurans]
MEDGYGAHAPDRLADRPVKGRGAVSNRDGRYEALSHDAVDDGWGSGGDGIDPDFPPPKLRTSIGIDAARSIITKNDSPDVPFDRSINPYRGCEHGCVYCFARPTHAYYGLSPGLDFESKLFWKPNAAHLLEKELSRKGYRPRTISIGTNTDPYQPIEREKRSMRAILEVLADFRHPVSIVTKSALVLRDLDILGPMGRDGLARVSISITTLDRHLANVMEPRASTPGRRLDAIQGLAAAGVPTSVMTAPIIPGLTCHEAEAILKEAAARGAGGAGYVMLRLPLEIAGLFEEWLAAHAPDRKDRVLKLVREMRGGKLYDARWGERMRGTGAYAETFRQRYRIATRRFGLDKPLGELDCSRFHRPPRPGDQMALF